MKKLIVLFILAFSIVKAQDPAFYKGALVADLTYGVDVYKVKYHYALKSNASADTTIEDGAGSRGWTIGAQYGVVKWLGLGLRAKFDNYFTDTDKVTKRKPTVTGFEIGAVVDFHPVRKQHFDLILGAEMGYSSLLYDVNDGQNTQIYGTGSWFNFHITPRLYFGRFGIGISLNFPRINYPNMTTNDKNINNLVVSSWKATGFGFNFGLSYRFLKDRG